MKKFLFLLTGLMCMLVSCGGGEDSANEPTPTPNPTPNEPTASITVNTNIPSGGLAFDVKGGEKSVDFTTNKDWTVTVAATTGGATWCTASPTSGKQGDATVKFTVKENTDYDDRSVSVTIKAGTASKTFTINQKGAEALLVTTTKYEVEQAGGEIEVEVQANIDYEMEISETAKSWISEATTRALTTHKHTFTIAANEEVEKREGEIVFKSGDKVETVKVYQAGGAVLVLSQNEFNVSDAGEVITIDVKSNIDFGVQMPDADWISNEAATRGMSSHTLKYDIAPNETYDAREAEIVFYDKNSDLKETVKIVQVQKDAIIISNKSYEVKAEGETIEVKLSANVEFDVTMPDVDWISQVTTRGLTEHTLYYKVAENTGEDSRSAEIVFTNKGSGVENKVIINQEGTKPKADITINVAEAGTLSTYIAEDRIMTLTNVKIVGDLNGDDFNIIRRMSSLKFLDLSEANIVSGGIFDSRLEYNIANRIYLISVSVETDILKAGMIPSSVEYFILPKSLIKIEGVKEGTYTFSPFRSKYSHGSGVVKYSLLKNIEISNNLKIIGHGAFTATEITEINLENVDSIGSYAFYGCRQLSEVTFQNPNLHVIESNAFGKCYKLANISLPNGVEEIGEEAFNQCRHERIDLPSSLKKIGKYAFCTKYDDIPETTNVYLSDLDSWCNIELGDIYSSPFYLHKDNNYNEDVNSLLHINDKLITNLEINGVDNIKNYVFAGCKSIESVSIGNKITAIGKESFKGCDNIAQLNIGNGVKTISNGAFSYCNKLEKVTLGKGIEKVEEYAFNYTKPSEVYCYATTPPQIVSSSNFNKIDKNTAKLYVPKGTYSAYYLSNWGSIFTNIIEME